MAAAGGVALPLDIAIINPALAEQGRRLAEEIGRSEAKRIADAASALTLAPLMADLARRLT